ncbi:hypothetical protein MAR_016859, partial [Mya arenaria]
MLAEGIIIANKILHHVFPSRSRARQLVITS